MNENKSGRLEKASSCPHCSHSIDAYTCTEGFYEPSSGDITVCVYCMTILTYTDDMSLKFAVVDDLDDIEEERLPRSLDGDRIVANLGVVVVDSKNV